MSLDGANGEQDHRHEEQEIGAGDWDFKSRRTRQETIDHRHGDHCKRQDQPTDHAESQGMWSETRRHWLQAIIEHNNEESEADQEPRVDQKVAYVWQAVPTIRPPVVVDPLCCREVRV